MGTQHRTTLGTNCKNLRSNSRLCVVATIETLVLTHAHTHALIELLYLGEAYRQIFEEGWRSGQGHAFLSNCTCVGSFFTT